MQKGGCKQRWRRVGLVLGSCLALGAEAAGGTANTISPQGASPGAGVVSGSDGAVYGTTREGGDSAAGTVYRLNPDGSNFHLLHHFAGGTGGTSPDCTVVAGWDGTWYGTATGGGLGYGLVFSLNPGTAEFMVLYTFTGKDGDGAYPAASLVQGSSGALYGVCYSGGETDVGTVFTLNLDGTGYKVLHSFNVQDGAWPRAPLALGWDGALYGTCYSGGASNVGVVFKLNPDGSAYQVIHTFADNGPDGRYPFGPLLQGWDWALYGTTSAGGSSNAGTVFKLNNDGTDYTVLHSFSRGGRDGVCPYTTLVHGWDWALYGTTFRGGSNHAGTVFRIGLDGSTYGVIHHFGQAGDGVGPYSTLVQGKNYKMYGTTLRGGTNNVGTVFRLNVDGTDYQVLHAFVATTNGSGGPGPVPPPRLSSLRLLSDKTFQFTLVGASNLVWRLEVATNLVPPVRWEEVARLIDMDGMVQFTDLGATNYARRYYRVVWP